MIINEVEVKSIVTKTGVPAGDHVINPYIGCPHRCMYCYADYMRRFTGHGEKCGDFLDVKIYPKKLKLSGLAGKKVVFCSVTDAYNPFEKKYRVTRNLLEQLFNPPICIQGAGLYPKRLSAFNPVVRRDLPLQKQRVLARNGKGDRRFLPGTPYQMGIVFLSRKDTEKQAVQKMTRPRRRPTLFSEISGLC